MLEEDAVLALKDCWVKGTSILVKSDSCFVAIEHCEFENPISCTQEFVQKNNIVLRQNIFRGNKIFLAEE